MKVVQVISNTKIDLREKILIDFKKTTFLHLACISSNALIVEFLLQSGADLEDVDQDLQKPIEILKLMENV